MSYTVLRILSVLPLLLFVILPGPLAARPPQQVAPVPIYTIQGPTMATAMAGRWVDAYGVVTGATPTGFYLQDPVGDGNPATSDGIFVYTHDRPTVQVGACVLVARALVSEFYEKTELSRIRTVVPADDCVTTTITPVELPMLRWGADPAAHYERFEGMLVQTQNLEGVVHGPTKHYISGEVEISFLPALFVPYVDGERIFHTDVAATAHLVYLSNLAGASLPEAGWGDHIAVGEATGNGHLSQAILDYNFGKYQLLPLPEAPVWVESQPLPTEVGLASTDSDFTVCTFNLHGLGRGSAQFPNQVHYQAHIRQRALVISERLQGCTIIGLQEIGSPQDGANLAAELYAVSGLSYQVVAFPGPQTSNSEFPLTNGLLARTENVRILAAAAQQGCSDRDFEVLDPASNCPPGQFPLFDRLPLVVDLSVAGAWGEPLTLRVVTNHWKSKAGDESVNAIQRERQARFVAALVQEALTADVNAHVIVLGDLNDFYISNPLEALQTGVQPPLVHTFDLLPAVDRYSYIFNGASQVLDHILVTPNLLPMLARVDVIHINADFAQAAQVEHTSSFRTSDHDPVQILLRPGGVAIVGGNVSLPGVALTLLDGSGNTIAETVSDALGDFRLWALEPGQALLRLNAPDYASYPLQDMTLSIQAGYNRVENLTPVHQSAEAGVALALLSPYLAEPTRSPPHWDSPAN